MYLATGIVFSLLTVQILTEECITPNNEKAECVSLYACPSLIGAIATRQEGSVEFVRQSNCGGTASNPMVCCGSSVNFIKANEHLGNRAQKVNLLPTRRYCGYQHSDDYFLTTNDSLPRITEFPWLAVILFNYTDGHYNVPTCSGSLINSRYVLTAAHCFNDSYLTPTGVRLGEYHISNDTDCVREPPFDEECSEVEVLNIEEMIPHPKYSLSSRTNDIALLRLNRKVSYSDYIRPICLPLPGTTLTKVGDTLTSSGWGWAGTSKTQKFPTEIKKRTLSTVIGNEQCAQEYSNIMVTINKNHLCTTAVNHSTNFECRGDSGGPLMFSHESQWYQEGIISFSRGCEGIHPTVYTRVANYLDWILENIEE